VHIITFISKIKRETKPYRSHQCYVIKMMTSKSTNI